MNINVEIPRTPVQIDGFPVYGFQSVQAAASWILTSRERANVAIALNAEKIITARREPQKFSTIREMAFFYPDGMPITWLLRRRGVKSARVPGVELWQALMEQAGERSIYLLGASEEVNRATAEKLRKDYGLTNLTRRNGYFGDESEVLDELAALKPDIVTVAMGSPKQEEFIAKALARCPNTFFMGVGGTYDVFTGHLPRAPKWMQKAGLEWLFRTLRQPRRVLRNVTYLKFLFLYATRRI